MNLSKAAKTKLKNSANISGDCEFIINRKSKWVVEVSLVRGLGILAKYKFHCKNMSCEKII